MDPIWDALSKACQENEARLAELRESSEKLPRDQSSWFYLKSDLLCPPCSHSDSEVGILPENGPSSFVSIYVERKEPASDQCPSSTVPAKRIKRDDVNHVSQVAELQDRNLQEVLSDPDFPEAVRKFVKLKGLKPAESLNESDTVSFCRYLLDSKSHLGEVIGTHLFSLILYPAICNAQKMFLSALLLEKIRELTNKFPVFMMNGVVIPVISRDDVEKQALDIVCDILSGMNEDNLHTTLKIFLTSLKRSDENSIKLLATVFKKKPKLDSEMAFILVMKLQNLSAQFSSSIQFGKLLLEVIPLLNAKVSESTLKTMKDILDHHTTFLKTTALKLFNNVAHT